MKKLTIGALLLTLIIAFAGCKAEAPKPESTPTVRPISVLNATVARLDNGTLLLAGIDEDATSSDLYSADYAGAEIIGIDGKGCGASELKAGMSVAIEYDGDISGNTAARKIPALKISIINEGSDLIGFYSGVLKDIFTADDALNDGIDTLAFDLSALTNLRESEKAALMYLTAKDLELSYVSGSYEELAAQGIIDTKTLFFPTGVLLKISTADETADSFSFDVSKWRSGDGAIGQNGCKAKLKDGIWSSQTGENWIS